ncbi:unnamed protein product [Cercospora beticola]|nr:unnamed protein product [Cercospora beticola]
MYWLALVGHALLRAEESESLVATTLEYRQSIGLDITGLRSVNAQKGIGKDKIAILRDVHRTYSRQISRQTGSKLSTVAYLNLFLFYSLFLQHCLLENFLGASNIAESVALDVTFLLAFAMAVKASGLHFSDVDPYFNPNSAVVGSDGKDVAKDSDLDDQPLRRPNRSGVRKRAFADDEGEDDAAHPRKLQDKKSDDTGDNGEGADNGDDGGDDEPKQKTTNAKAPTKKATNSKSRKSSLLDGPESDPTRDKTQGVEGANGEGGTLKMNPEAQLQSRLSLIQFGPSMLLSVPMGQVTPYRKNQRQAQNALGGIFVGDCERIMFRTPAAKNEISMCNYGKSVFLVRALHAIGNYFSRGDRSVAAKKSLVETI